MNPDTETPGIEAIMRAAPVIPVLVIEDAGKAQEIAAALVEGGLPALEVTLRTAAALDVMQKMACVDGAIVGAGTVTSTAQLAAALGAGARFVVSPGLTRSLGEAAMAAGVPFLPGVASAGEIMEGLELGLRHFKFFPAVANGGIPALQALAAPFGQAKFCPTGGITAATAPDWLALEQVLCVGGSWVVPQDAAPEAIRDLAARAAAL